MKTWIIIQIIDIFLWIWVIVIYHFLIQNYHNFISSFFKFYACLQMDGVEDGLEIIGTTNLETQKRNC